MFEPSSFVADGYERAVRAVEAQVRQEMRDKLAGQRRGASWLARLMQRWRHEKEIARRVRRLAPPDALY